MTCPQCGGSVTVTTGLVEGQAQWFPVRDAHGTGLARVPAVAVRPKTLQTWAGCDSCEWCGPVAQTKAVA